MHCSNSTAERHGIAVDFAAIAGGNSWYLMLYLTKRRTQSVRMVEDKAENKDDGGHGDEHLSPNDYTNTHDNFNEWDVNCNVHNIRRHCNNSIFFNTLILSYIRLPLQYTQIFATSTTGLAECRRLRMECVNACMIYITVFQLSNYWGLQFFAW